MERIVSLCKQLNYADEEQRRGVSVAEVCGIVGYVGDGNAVDYLMEGLRVLENRGYDSAGISTISQDKQLETTKFAGNAIAKLGDVVPMKHKDHHIGIAHTRWATHGAKTDENAHPHTDMNNRISLAHNGVIENSEELRAELMKRGVRFSSETDTEVIAQLIGLYVREGMETVEAVKKAEKQLQGTWGLVILDKEQPDQIIAAKNGSPILVGIGKGRMFLASEPSAFAQYTNQYIALKDGEVAVIHPRDFTVDDARVETSVSETVETSPSPYPHWTIREIFEQPLAISKSLNNGGRLHLDSAKLGGLEENKEEMLSIQNLLISACGTSYFASLYGAKIMQSIGAFNTVGVEDASEVYRDTFPASHAGLLVLSQSGETKDVHKVLNLADELGIRSFSVVNVVRSLIARTTGCGVYLNAGREVGVAATKSFTCQVTVLVLIALWFSANRPHAVKHHQRRRHLVDSLHRLPTTVGMTLHRVREDCRHAAEVLLHAPRCFILGKGLAEPIAKEGALKIKEITYLHTEGYAAGALKHGPFSLIEPSLPIILIILEDGNRGLMETTLQQVVAREAHTIVITDIADFPLPCQQVIYIPSNGALTALLAVIPLQLIAYELALLKNINPDRPRNLAKTVTVF